MLRSSGYHTQAVVVGEWCRVGEKDLVFRESLSQPGCGVRGWLVTRANTGATIYSP